MGFNVGVMIGYPAAEARSPARPAWSAWDDETVARMRRLRAGWDAVAKALGRATPDVRRRYDADWGGGAGGAVVAAAAPLAPCVSSADASPEGGRDARPLRLAAKNYAVRRGTVEARCLAMLRDGVSQRGVLCERLGRRPAYVSQLLAVLRAKGLAEPGLIDTVGRSHRWAITAAGRAQLQALAA